MFGHERSLVNKYGGQGFSLIGVSADPTAEELARVQKKADLNWPSFWDGPGGPIASDWKVDRYPTLILIDRQGTIRYRTVGVPAANVLESKIEELLRERMPAKLARR